jgi:hypothetical protein
MDLEDLLEPEVVAAAAVTAFIASPQVRNVLRQGAVFGLAGVIAAGDALGAFARGVGRGTQQAAGAMRGNGAQAAHDGGNGSGESSGK